MPFKSVCSNSKHRKRKLFWENVIQLWKQQSYIVEVIWYYKTNEKYITTWGWGLTLTTFMFDKVDWFKNWGFHFFGGWTFFFRRYLKIILLALKVQFENCCIWFLSRNALEFNWSYGLLVTFGIFWGNFSKISTQKKELAVYLSSYFHHRP